jgi:hypothetical protein
MGQERSLGRVVDVLKYSWISGGPWDVYPSGQKKIYATFRVSVYANDNHCWGISVRDEVLRQKGISRITPRMIDTLRENNVGRKVHLIDGSDGWEFEDYDELDLEV